MRWLALCIVVAACAGPAQRLAPTFRVPLLAGGELDTASIIGKRPAVLVFWASWCEPCTREAPLLVRAYERYAPGVAFVAVNIDADRDLPALRELVARLKLPYPIGLDPAGSALALYTDHVPLVIVIDAGGHVRRSFRSLTADQLERALAEVARTRSPSAPP